jgi:hypothetical protein
VADSVQSRILDAVVAALSGTGYTASRTQLTPYNAAALANAPQFNVVPLESMVDRSRSTTSASYRIFQFDVRCMGAAVNQVDKAIDPLYLLAVNTLLTDPTLGGLVVFTREVAQKWHFDTASQDVISHDVTFETEFSTARNDPSAAAN